MIRARNNPIEESARAELKPLSPKRSASSNTAASNSFAGQLSASSLQLYQSIKQHAKRKKSAVWSKDKGIWTVEVPKRMLFGTLGVFLVLPLLIFVWKELHPSAPSSTELRGSKQNIVRTNGKDKYVTWMEEELPEFNETAEDEGGRKKSSSIEVIAKGSSKLNNETKDESIDATAVLSASKNTIKSKDDDTKGKVYEGHLIAKLEGKRTGEEKIEEKLADGNNINNRKEQLEGIKLLFDAAKKEATQDAVAVEKDVDDDDKDDSVDDRSAA